MKNKLFLLSVALVTGFMSFYINKNDKLPIIAIANYGPHSSLNDAIEGFKKQMENEGFRENKTIIYEIADVGFDPSLIPQMISTLKAKNPKIMMVLTTPVAQAAKSKVKDMPIIYNAITDPIEGGLINNAHKSNENITGSSDMQDLKSFLQFAKSLLPNAKKVGLLYAISENNDRALLNMMKEAVLNLNMEIVAIPVEQPRDVAIRMQKFKGEVDLIYVGTSGPIQPTLPTIAAEARKMHIPLFNVEGQAVRDGLALASFGVSYKAVGNNAGKLAAEVLRGKQVSELAPIYPTFSDHHKIVNKKIAEEFNINLPTNIEIVE